jgi:hypothetical protein
MRLKTTIQIKLYLENDFHNSKKEFGFKSSNKDGYGGTPECYQRTIFALPNLRKSVEIISKS